MSGLKKPLSYLLILAMVSLSLPHYSARAAMVPTEAVIEGAVDGQSDRARLRALVQREDIRAQLQAYGIEPGEALARVDGLSDREAAEIAGRLDELPAGSDAVVYAVLLLVLLFFVLIIMIFVNAVKGVAKGARWILEDMQMEREKERAGQSDNSRPRGTVTD